MNFTELHNQTLKAHQERKFEEALNGYNELLGARPETWYYPYTLGTLFCEIGKNGIAIPLFQRSLDIEEKAETLCNLGICYRKEGHYSLAEKCYARAYELDPNPEYLNNWTGLYVNDGQPQKCIDLCDKALEKTPDSAQVQSHKALALLEIGRYKEGWDLYDSRFKLQSWHDRKYPGVFWDGSPVDTLVIHGEQGLGDEILFCSLVHDAQQIAKNVVIECNFKLVKLFERSFGVPCFKDSADLLASGVVPDAWIPMGSLPRIFGVDKPVWEMHASRQRKGYLKPDPLQIRRLMMSVTDGKPVYGGNPRIGLSWFGGTKDTHAHLRNFGLEKWKRFIKPEFEYISLQYGDAEQDAKFLGINYQPVTDDLDEFASRVASCDLVISVCNTTIHFAGALNVPVWVLVPNKPAWRYGITGERMLWYASARMFRQDKTWTDVAEKVEAALANL